MRITIYIIIVMILLSLNSFAQGDAKYNNDSVFINKYRNSLGFGAGFSTGFGMSYRHYLNNDIGFQLNFLNSITERNIDASVGVSILFRLVETEKLHFFAYQGNHFIYSKYKYDFNPYGTSNWINGLGVGVEIYIRERIGFNIMWGYAYHQPLEGFTMTGETGIYYRLY